MRVNKMQREGKTEGHAYELALKDQSNAALGAVQAHAAMFGAVRNLQDAIKSGEATRKEAIQAIKQQRPDVLVSDIAMPDEDGYGLIQKVRLLENGESQSIPAVAITAYAKEEDRKRALSSGFQIYLAKPVEMTELVKVVARAARRDF